MMNSKFKKDHPPICDYEGSDYQTRFWEQGGREYEDACEVIALQGLLPNQGKLLLEIGAGAGRNTLRYKGFERIVLLDYSTTQLQLAKMRLGDSTKYIYVAADIYRLPFIEHLFDAATMIRVLHHLVEPLSALHQIRNTLQPRATFILEFANKRNIKAIIRFFLHQQNWNPFSLEPIEINPLNYNFHPRHVYRLLTTIGFNVKKVRSVSHFRIGLLKKTIPLKFLIFLESLIQWTGIFIQLSPSIFIRSQLNETFQSVSKRRTVRLFFKCPNCNHKPLKEMTNHLFCSSCLARWPIKDGIYIFKDT